jgi:acyl-CoA thioesterase-1
MRKICCFVVLAGLALTASGCRSDATSGQAAESRSDTATPSAPAALSPAPQAQSTRPAAPVSSPISASSQTKDPRPLLVCFGDSLTAGVGIDPGQSYPDYLQTDLDKLHYHYRVDNEGVSGNTTKDGVERLPEVLALHPAVAIVEFGGNDGLRGLPIEDTRANLDQIVGTLKRAGIKVALAGITLPPDYGADYVDQFDQTYTLLAAKYHVPMLPFLLKNVYGVPGMMQHDDIHATARGNQVVARNVIPIVLPLLKR